MMLPPSHFCSTILHCSLMFSEHICLDDFFIPEVLKFADVISICIHSFFPCRTICCNLLSGCVILILSGWMALLNHAQLFSLRFIRYTLRCTKSSFLSLLHSSLIKRNLLTQGCYKRSSDKQYNSICASHQLQSILTLK